MPGARQSYKLTFTALDEQFEHYEADFRAMLDGFEEHRRPARGRWILLAVVAMIAAAAVITRAVAASPLATSAWVRPITLATHRSMLIRVRRHSSGTRAFHTTRRP